MTLGRVNASAQKDDLGMLPPDVVDHPIPERERFRVRVVDPEEQDSLVDPEADRISERDPERGLRALCVEVEIDDVLVFFRRVLCVTDRPVGSPGEPFGMLLKPGVIGRGLDGEIEGDLEIELPRF